MPLRASAPEFVPAAAPARREIVLPDDLFSEDAHVVEEQVLSDDSEEGITPEALEELEATEAWVETMAMCEEMEREHLIMFALEHAPPEMVEAIEQRAAANAGKGQDVPRSGKKAGKAKHAHVAPRSA